MERGLVAVGEAAGGLEHEIDAQVRPRQLGWILLCQHFHRIAIDHEAVGVRADFAGKTTMDGIVFQQMR